MEGSHLASLPAELRNHIYSLALFSPEKMILDFEFVEKHGRLRVGGPQHLLALTETCRQIRGESLPLFYSNTDFMVVIGDLKWTADSKNVKSAYSKEPLRLFRDWLRAIGFESARSIRSVEMYAYVLPHEGARRHIVYAMTLLSSVVRFFVRTGAAVKFTLEGELVTVMKPGIFFMTFDDLPIHDPKAARITYLNTWTDYLESWGQSYLDGTIDDLAFNEYNESGLVFARLTKNFLYDLEERLDDEPKVWNWVFAEEAELTEGRKRSEMVALKMPTSWVDGVKKREE